MKTLIAFTFTCLVLFTSQAQDNRFEKTMQRHIQTLDTAKSTTTLQELANQFERISNAEQNEWLPAYYSALCYINLASNYSGENSDKVDPLLDNADAFIDKARERDGDESELLTLEGYSAQMRLVVDPMGRGQKYSTIANEKFFMAISENERNPRPHMLLGINLMYTPEQFGGGAKRARPHLEKALALFEGQDSDNLYPKWGGDTAEYMMKVCKKKLEE